MTHKQEKVKKFNVLKCWISLLRAQGFSCSLNVSQRGLRISKLQFLGRKILFFQLYIFFNFWSSNPQISIRIRIWIRIDRKFWILIRSEANAYPEHWFLTCRADSYVRGGGLGGNGLCLAILLIFCLSGPRDLLHYRAYARALQNKINNRHAKKLQHILAQNR